MPASSARSPGLVRGVVQAAAGQGGCASQHAASQQPHNLARAHRPSLRGVSLASSHPQHLHFALPPTPSHTHPGPSTSSSSISETSRSHHHQHNAALHHHAPCGSPCSQACGYAPPSRRPGALYWPSPHSAGRGQLERQGQGGHQGGRGHLQRRRRRPLRRGLGQRRGAVSGRLAQEGGFQERRRLL